MRGATPVAKGAAGQPSANRTTQWKDPAIELEWVDGGKMNLQLIANEENQDRAQCGKNEAGGMILFVCLARKHVGNAAADDRSEDAEHDRPEDRYKPLPQRKKSETKRPAAIIRACRSRLFMLNLHDMTEAALIAIMHRRLSVALCQRGRSIPAFDPTAR
jgi:hypothetical protein